MNNQDKLLTNAETMRHILTVRSLLLQCIKDLTIRANEHDKSKLEELEVESFIKFTPKLKNTVYGSDEYNKFLQDMKPSLDHHYKHNSHHPQHYENGINGMNLFDILEMLCDWKASTLRTKDGDLTKSLFLNKERFAIDDQLFQIINNTIPIIEELAKESNINVSYPQ